MSVWSDVSRFLTDPSTNSSDELLAESSDAGAQAVAEAERASLLDARNSAQDRRRRAIDLYTRAKLSDTEFDAVAADVERELKTLDERLADLEPDEDVATTPSPRMCSRRSVNGWPTTYQRPSDGRSFSC